MLILVAGGYWANAQQLPQYSQYMLNDYILNPAVTGTRDYYEVKANNRYQWMGIDDAPRTYILSMHGPHKKKSMGLGGAIFSDVTGPTSRVGAYLSYAYHLKLSEKMKLSMGLSAGLLQFKIDGTKITLREDGDPALTESVQSVLTPDATFGLQLYGEKGYFGISAPQLIGQKLKFFEAQDPLLSSLARHYMAMGGYKFYLGDDFFIEPSFLLKYVSPVPMQIDLGLRLDYRDQIWLGGAYRFNDAFSALIGFSINKYLSFGYSYDMSLSNLKNYSSGSHEVMIAARFKSFRKQSVPEEPAEEMIVPEEGSGN